jgi:hypothetical protein
LKYRKFGSLNWEASVLGLGTAGLPYAKVDPRGPDRASSIEMIRYAIDRGVNCLDLGYPYNLRRQERIARMIGDALQDGYQEKVRIFITLPSHLIRSAKDFQLYLDKQLDWLGIAKAEFCMLGRLNRENWPLLRNLGALKWADEVLDTHRNEVLDTHRNNAVLDTHRNSAVLDTHCFENIGFSFNDHFQILKSVLASYDRWAFCQFDFSYMEVDRDPGISGIKHAAEKGLAVAVTGALKEGRLVKAPAAPVARIWEAAGELNRLADLGLSFVWSYPEIATAFYDAGSLNEIFETAAIANHAAADNLTIPEEISISRVRDEYRKLKRIPCASCRPCMPCPEGIDVPRIFEIYNEAFIYEDVKTARAIYQNELHDIARCTRCRICEERCVKRLSIIDWIDEARQLLEMPRHPRIQNQ